MIYSVITTYCKLYYSDLILSRIKSNKCNFLINIFN